MTEIMVALAASLGFLIFSYVVLVAMFLTAGVGAMWIVWVDGAAVREAKRIIKRRAD